MNIALGRAVLGGALGRHRGRLALATLAIALGVALGFAVAIINATAVGEFEAGMRTLAGTADLEIRGGRGGFDEALFARVARDADVAATSPVVEVEARIVGRDDALRIEGVDAFRAATVTPALVGMASDPLDLLRGESLFVTPSTLAWLGKAEGDMLVLQVGQREVSLRIAGTLPGTATQRLGAMDIAAAQDLFARDGTLSHIALRLRAGADVQQVQQRLAGTLPPGTVIATPDDNATNLARMTRAYRVNLNVLALVALFTGGLLVFSTQALSVVRRRAQFALLRTLGLTGPSLQRWILVEGALLGALGSLVGIAAGIALAAGTLHVLGADLGAGYFRGALPTLVIEPVAAAAFAAMGIAFAVGGSLLPARDAARAMPAAALKAGDEEQAFARLHHPGIGVVALTAGALATLLPPIGELPLAGYAAIALLLFGTLLLLPQLAAWMLARVPSPSSASTRLALLQLRGAPGAALVSLATIVASVSLMVSMAIMVASFRASLDDWLLRILPADVYVRAAAAGDTGWFDLDAQRALRNIRGVARIDFLRTQSVVLDPGRPRVTLLARDLPASDPGSVLPLLGDTRTVSHDGLPSVWISEAIADLFDIKVGTTLQLPLADRVHPFVVAGLWRDYARQQGALVIERAVYTRLTGDGSASDAAIWLQPGVTVAEFRNGLDAAWPDASGLTLATPGDIRTMSLRIFDRTFAVTYALEAAAVIIGLTGLSSAFGALVLARRREFGMLRHLGMTRGQIRRMLATEGLLVSGIGLKVGFLLGFAMSLILIHVVNRQSFHWGMELHTPWLSLVAFAIVLLALAVATTQASARAALADDAVRAVRDDW
ncbi:MAG: FtsX-like permease family protein [Betaproteobacteria bacterium]